MSASASWGILVYYSLLAHGVLGVVLYAVPPRLHAPSTSTIELTDRQLPPEPPPAKEPIETAKPQAKALLPETPVPPKRVKPRRRAEKSLPKQFKPATPTEPARQTTAPQTFGLPEAGTTTAAPGQGVALPKGDSVDTDTLATKRGQARRGRGGFKKTYEAGEAAPLAVLSSWPKLKQRSPVPYPERMRELGIEGRVTLQLTVDETGRVVRATVVKSLHPMLDRAALLAVKTWQFSPALVRGVPVSVKIPFEIDFVLD
ncbi:MAG: energy transducer TonB [Deltaproteobacteria bacterium]|nr:energy transducer TonB [Deltaproteobacteria bacterium]